MLSTIKFDIDENNNPIIKIKHRNSEDVRDKIVKRFIQDGGSIGLKLPLLQWENNGDGWADVNIVLITPEDAQQWVDHYKNLKTPKTETGNVNSVTVKME